MSEGAKATSAVVFSYSSSLGREAELQGNEVRNSEKDEESKVSRGTGFEENESEGSWKEREKLKGKPDEVVMNVVLDIHRYI